MTKIFPKPKNDWNTSETYKITEIAQKYKN